MEDRIQPEEVLPGPAGPPVSHPRTAILAIPDLVPHRIIESSGPFPPPRLNLAGDPRVRKIQTLQEVIVVAFGSFKVLLKSLTNFDDFSGPPPSAAPRVNNNVQSNFKRQNTVDTATIKENTPRYSGSRPATATAVTSKTSSSQQGKYCSSQP